MTIETKDYGLIAYVIMKYDGVRTSNGVTVDTDKSKIEIIKEYNTSDFFIYNLILKDVVKKG